MRKIFKSFELIMPRFSQVVLLRFILDLLCLKNRQNCIVQKSCYFQVGSIQVVFLQHIIALPYCCRVYVHRSTPAHSIRSCCPVVSREFCTFCWWRVKSYDPVMHNTAICICFGICLWIVLRSRSLNSKQQVGWYFLVHNW